MQVGKVDANREGRLVLQNGLMDCCDIVNRFVCLMQVGMLDVNREVRFTGDKV